MSIPGIEGAHAVADGLYGMRGEIGASLARVRSDIQRYPRADAAAPPLQAAAGELRSVRGTLATIDCFGAGLLAQEMMLLLEALSSGRAAGEDACAVLSGASLQLADYVELLAQGARDCAQLLQPTLSELRLARGESPLTAFELFTRQLRAQPLVQIEIDGGGDAVRARTLARRVLPDFRHSFLHWYHGRDAGAAMAALGGIAERIAEAAEAPPLRELWAAYAALAACLRADDAGSLDRQRTFGTAAAQLKLLAEVGEPEALARLDRAQPQVLFELARVAQPGERAQELSLRLRLDVLLPSTPVLAGLRARLRGPRPQRLEQLRQELQREFWYLGEELAEPQPAGAAAERLRRIAAGIGALGLPAAQHAALNHAAALDSAPDAAGSGRIGAAVQRLQQSLEQALFHGLEFGVLAPEVPRAIDAQPAAESASVAVEDRATVVDVAAGAVAAASPPDFVAAQEQLLDTLDRHQAAWAYGDSTVLDELGGGLRAFAANARVAGVSALDQVARGLESELERFDAAAAAPLQWRLAAGIEGLHRLLGNLARGEALDAPGLLDAIGISAHASENVAAMD